MADNAFDIEIVFVGGGFGARQHVFGVKDIKAFILHRTHVEEVHGDNHIDVEIVFQAEAGFVPLHGRLQRGHRPTGTIQIAAIDKQFQRNITARARFKAVPQHVEITRHQREQIARFRERILPLYPVTTIFQLPFSNAVTVGEQIWIFCFIGNKFSGEAREHVRAIQIPGNVAETFGLALGTKRLA